MDILVEGYENLDSEAAKVKLVTEVSMLAAQLAGFQAFFEPSKAVSQSERLPDDLVNAECIERVMSAGEKVINEKVSGIYLRLANLLIVANSVGSDQVDEINKLIDLSSLDKT